MNKNQDIAIERALNQAKNKLKGQGQKTKKAMQDQLKLKKDNEQKDWRLDDLKSRLEKAVSEEHLWKSKLMASERETEAIWQRM